MPKYSPPKAYWYLRKQDRRRANPNGAPPPLGFVYVVDSSGAYVVDSTGAYVLTSAS